MMQTLIKTLLILAIASFSFSFVNAQDDGNDEQWYHILDYMKVPPGGEADYMKLEKAWKKIHQRNVDNGKYVSWNLSAVRLPAGANEEYNYLTRMAFKGTKQLANYMDKGLEMNNLKELLSADELDLVKRTGKIRTHVKTEVWATMEAILPEDMEQPAVVVFNFFDYPEGKDRGDHLAIERNIWMPIHEARIEKDQMEGWVLLGLMSPYGSAVPYHDATVDIYKSWDQYMNVANADQVGFRDVNPGANPAMLLKQTTDNTDLVRQEVRIPLDRASGQ